MRVGVILGGDAIGMACAGGPEERTDGRTDAKINELGGGRKLGDDGRELVRWWVAAVWPGSERINRL